VNNGKTVKTCGREPTCELVLDHPTISRLHARIELADDGLVAVRDSGSQNGTFLNRNDNWIRIGNAILCIGDRIRFGDVEVPLERLTAVFGEGSGARLEARHFARIPGATGTRNISSATDHGAALTKPRRNPVTGKIEEQRSPPGTTGDKRT
jgi:pSer/pThr/pTyr-binding forkhead associated (FHA) protein